MSHAVVQKRESFPVAIVGGGIAGLTLALSFEQLGIRYALYERYASLAPDQGASIGLLPNGLRILDQLGLVKEIEDHTAALQRWFHLGAEGELLSTVHALGYYETKSVIYLPLRFVCNGRSICEAYTRLDSDMEGYFWRDRDCWRL